MTIHSLYRARHGKPDGLDVVLDRRVSAVLSTENPDGTPHSVPVWFVYDGDSFRFRTSSSTRKARNVTERPHARVLVEHRGGWVSALGGAELQTGDDAIRSRDVIAGKYLTEEGKQTLGRVLDEHDDAAIVMTPEEWLAWDLTEMLDAVSARGHSTDRFKDWFLPGDE